jgi:hypothetical protein
VTTFCILLWTDTPLYAYTEKLPFVEMDIMNVSTPLVDVDPNATVYMSLYLFLGLNPSGIVPITVEE